MASYVQGILKKNGHRALIVICLACACLSAGAIFAESNTEPKRLPEHFFFGDNKPTDSDESQVYDEAFPNANDQSQSSGISEENRNSQDQWVDEDISPLFPELEILDELGTRKSLQRTGKAKHFFHQARQRMLQANSDAANSRTNHHQANTRYDWEKIDQAADLKRLERRILAQGRIESVSYLIQAIRELDQVKNPAVLKSDTYLDLKSAVYREYVKLQFQNRNLNHCIDVLQRYVKLRPAHQQEPEVHRLLAACYRSEELQSDRSRNNKARIMFKKLKNTHLLEYALLAYGKDSHQYKFIREKVDRDMIEVVGSYE
ncbi:MAG: hypothetical protein KDK39_09395 [Leptospiraceae bacterium]|nr:hypothetical protein [Leptospiraceae bacterium]